MTKRIIALFLIFSMVIMNITNVKAFAAVNTVITKDSEENIKIYRKTSLAPSEEKRKFNIPFHSNEPLGLEVLGETQVEVTITGDGIYGSANLNLHDVDNLRSITSIKVGETKVVNIPRKGELFLDVAGVKFNNNQSTEDFSFNVNIKLVSDDYKVTPTYDIRDNKISDKTIQDADEFKNIILSQDNAEDGALLISENIRLYIPKSKYINKNINPDRVLYNHEKVIREFDRMAGLDVNAESDINKPRENFVLVSARNEQVGYMSAGGEMVDTLPRNIFEYLKDIDEDMWGMYHEYGHLYEQGWGFIEYWNNIFANNMKRIDTGNPDWAWIYGNKTTYENETAIPSYIKVLKENTLGTIHPMYFFLSFIDNLDPDFMQNISTFYRENSISYGGWDYVAYFAAKKYNKNIIPYIESAGGSVTNAQVIKEVIENSKSTYIYFGDRAEFNEVKGISMPATVDILYTGENKEIKGMSNPNSEIYIEVDGKEFTTTTDENGKFSYKVNKAITTNSVIKVASKEDGKEKSVYKTVKIRNSENIINFKGFKDETFLTVTLDNTNNTFKAISSGKVANIYAYVNEYVKIEHYSKDNVLKGTYTMSSGSTADNLASTLNGKKYIDGDYIKLKHAEPSRLIISGEVKDAPYILESGVSNLNLNNSYFYIIDGGLKYSQEKLSLKYNKDDLLQLIAEIDKLNKEDYTKSTWTDLESKLNEAKEIVNNEQATKDEINSMYNELLEKKSNLKAINIIKFNGYNNLTALQIRFNMEDKKFIAVSNSVAIHPFFGGSVYASLTHYDKKGNVKGTYEVRANQTANEVANRLNGTSFVEGDYLKLSHIEAGWRLRVEGYVKNSPEDFSDGIELDLNNSYFYLNGENLEYSNVQLDLSANKDDLKIKIEEAKKITADNYTNTSYEALQNEISKAEALVDGANIDQAEIDSAINAIDNAIASLRQVNKISFLGLNDLTFLSLEFDMKNNKFVAVSNGQNSHIYQGGSEYIKITHYDKKGNVKGTYAVRGTETANKVAEALNKASFVVGDYLKLYHKEQSGRLRIAGYIENLSKDISKGVGNLDLNTSYFYITGENLKYSNVQLDLSADKEGLKAKIQEAKAITSEGYTKESFENLKNAIAKAEELVNTTNVYEEEINEEIEALNSAMAALRKVNKINFLGYNDLTFLSLEFDMENNKFVAVSNKEQSHKFFGGTVYVTLTHYDKKGNVKGTYSVKGTETADKVADALNKVTFSNGDYLKLYHKEQNGRLRIAGYIKNLSTDISKGVGSLDLNTSYFYINGENLEYSNVQLDLSANKDLLRNKIAEAKEITEEGYTKSSFESLQNAIVKAEELVNTPNVYEEEVNEEIEALNSAIESLRKVNKINFLGLNDLTFLSLEFDMENNKFVAVSNGQNSHIYQGGSEYIKITHYDKKGNVKGTYAVRGTETANKVAEALNKTSFADGDYIKLYHKEQSGRLRIAGYIENLSTDISRGVGNLDLNNSYFYITGENLKYSNVQLDLSADKEELKAKIQEAKEISEDGYTKESFENLKNVIAKAEELVNTPNVYEEEINLEIEALNSAMAALRKVNKINFLGYNDLTFLSLEFDMENNKFIAASNKEQSHKFFGGTVYATLTHYDKKGNVKGTYSVKGTETADKVAEELNKVTFADGDYLKLYHREQNNRLRVIGYIENLDTDISRGVGNLDLNTSYFYITGENLKYSNVQLDLSADKEELKAKIQEAKEITSEGYTKSTFEALKNSITKAEELVNTPNVYEEEVNTEIEALNNAIESLRKVNTINFLGYNDLTFLSLGFDMENNKFVAVSNGQNSHIYQGGSEYIRITHYSQSGEVKGTYSVRGTETANKVADELNNASFEDGDYIKLYHKEQNGRLRIAGYIENLSKDISRGVGNLDLNTSYFYITGENLSYQSK